MSKKLDDTRKKLKAIKRELEQVYSLDEVLARETQKIFLALSNDIDATKKLEYLTHFFDIVVERGRKKTRHT